MTTTREPTSARFVLTPTHAALARQLRAVLRLTQTEAQTAQLRVAQARTDQVCRDLTDNAESAQRRSRDITRELRALGGVPDAITPVVGRVTALLRGTVEQAEPFDSALLDDLALEQELLGRARYLRMLAHTASVSSVEALAERLEVAHNETIEWINTVLAEEAMGGPAALRATPLQRAAGGVTRVLGLPVRLGWAGANRVLNQAQALRERAGQAVDDAGDRAVRLGEAAREVAVSGRDASMRRAEQVAGREHADDTAAALHEARTELGTLEATELPIGDYATLSQQDAVRAVKQLTDGRQVRTVLNYEHAHRARAQVISAGETRLAALAREAAARS